MEKILCLDYGKKRTGIAISDPSQTIAFPLKTLLTCNLIPFLQQYIPEENIRIIVVGWPINLDGSQGHATQLVASFIRFLKHHFSQISIAQHDERFTSKMAAESLVLAGLKRKKRREKERLDTISATLILQSFLAAREHAQLTDLPFPL
ncbi:MAG: Holliday junction resolvase RuvX [Cytophagales bacterium]